MRLVEHPDFEQAVLHAQEHFRGRGLRPAIIEKDYFVTALLHQSVTVATGLVRKDDVAKANQTSRPEPKNRTSLSQKSPDHGIITLTWPSGAIRQARMESILDYCAT